MMTRIRFLLPLIAVTFLTLTSCGAQSPAVTEAKIETRIPDASATIPAPETLTPLPTPTNTAMPTSAPTATAVEVITTGISYINNVLPILQSRCGNCHGTNNPREGLTITTYDGIMAGSQNGLVIKPGDPDNSFLIKQIRDGEMPKKGPKLTPEQLQILIDWILQGALNN